MTSTNVTSPSSVLEVMHEDDGFEVLLPTSHRATTKEGSKNLKSVSLLDMEQTPTRRHDVLVVRTPSAVIDTGICCTKLEDAIDALLSKPIQIGSFSSDWQWWSYFGSTTTTAADGAKTEAVNEKMKEDARKILRKKFYFSINDRKNRMNTRREELSPFAPTPTRPHRMPQANKLGSVKSFDLVLDRRQRNLPDTKTKHPQQTDISSLVSMCGACHVDTGTTTTSPAVVRSSMLDQDEGYDSDPEIRRSDSTRRRLFILDEDSTHSEPGNKENLTASPSVKRMHQHPVDSEEYISHAVQEFLNERFTLILHSTGQEGKPIVSYAVKAWFERGQHLGSNKVIQPRFQWYKKERKNTGTSRRIALPDAKNVSGFDLVDVARVLAVDSIDRKLYPFASAKPSACLLIKTWEDSKDQRCWLFEAATKSERERIVRWMKLCVARLASKLIVGDNSLFEEFFLTHMPDSGPGEEPDLFY